MSGGLASINIKFTTNLSEFSSALQNQSRQIKKFGGEIQSMGQTLTIGLTAPIVAFGVASVMAFDQSAQAVAQVDAALKSTGGTVGYTSEQLQKMAADLQSVTTFDDDEILKKATANLLTFSKITGDTFQQAQKAALDLSTRLDGDLQGAAIQVGKALNDPIKGITALSRVGVSFSASQKEAIAAMVKTNDLAGAQTLILNELQKEFGGSAEAAAKAGLGGYKQLGNILGDLSEDFGKIILEAFEPFREGLKSIALYLKDLSPEAKKTIAVIGGIVAVIGPLMIGVGGLISLLPTLATGFAALTGPIGLTVAALAAVAYVVADNWDVVKQTLVDVANYFIDLYNSSTVFRAGVEYVILTFKNLWAEVKFVFNNIKSIAEFTVRNVFNYFSSLGKLIKAVLTLDVAGIKSAFKEGFGSAADSVGKLYDDVKKNSVDMAKELGKNVSGAVTNTLNGKKIAKIKIPKENVDASGVASAVATGMGDGAGAGAKKIKEKLEEIKIDFNPSGAKGTISFYDAQISKLQQFRDEIATTAQQVKAANDAIKNVEFAKSLNFDPTSLVQITGGFDKMVAEMQAKVGGLQAVADSVKTVIYDLSTVVGDAVEQLAENAAVGFGEAIGGIISGTETLSGVLGNMLGLISSFMKDLGKQLIAIGIARIAFDKLKFSGIGAVAAGIALVALSTVVTEKFSNAGKFTNGGIVGGTSFYGDKIMARVNSQEMISNTDQQRKIWGAMNSSSSSSATIIPDVRIKGSDLLIVFGRAEERKNRIG